MSNDDDQTKEEGENTSMKELWEEAGYDEDRRAEDSEPDW